MGRPGRSPWELLAFHVILQAAQDVRDTNLPLPRRLAAAGWLAHCTWAHHLAEFAGLDARWVRKRAREQLEGLLASHAGRP